MSFDEITAPEMARERGIDPKAFRHALRQASLRWHAHGAPWAVVRGSSEHEDMKTVLAKLVRGS
jgi:hypothetical protein